MTTNSRKYLKSYSSNKKNKENFKTVNTYHDLLIWCKEETLLTCDIFWVDTNFRSFKDLTTAIYYIVITNFTQTSQNHSTKNTKSIPRPAIPNHVALITAKNWLKDRVRGPLEVSLQLPPPGSVEGFRGNCHTIAGGKFRCRHITSSTTTSNPWHTQNFNLVPVWRKPNLRP